MEFYYQQARSHFACTGCQEQAPPVGEVEQLGAVRLLSAAVARWAREGL